MSFTMTQKKIKNFEEAISRLESIVLQLEEGSISLEESVEVFKEGMELTKYCRDKLDKAELELKKLVKDADGNFSIESE